MPLLVGCHQNSTTNEPELLCKNRGVDFAEVYAKIQVQYDLYDADNSIKGKLAHSQEEARGAGYSGLLSLFILQLHISVFFYDDYFRLICYKINMINQASSLIY